jgi:hypothetical protein
VGKKRVQSNPSGPVIGFILSLFNFMMSEFARFTDQVKGISGREGLLCARSSAAFSDALYFFSLLSR